MSFYLIFQVCHFVFNRLFFHFCHFLLLCLVLQHLVPFSQEQRRPGSLLASQPASPSLALQLSSPLLAYLRPPASRPASFLLVLELCPP